MGTVLLVRHGLTAMTGPVLAGRTPGVHLDERGQKQAATLAERLAAVPLTAVVTSPLERCVETATAIRDAQPKTPAWHVDERLIECGYGDWTGRPIKELVKDPLWKVVQQHPSAAVFPGPEGEGLAQTQARAVAAVREWNAKLGPDAVWLACSHGDVIKAILADALGTHLDTFQRILVNPASVSVVRYTETRPYVVTMNSSGSDLASMFPPRTAPAKRSRRARSSSDDAPVGGGLGSQEPTP
jgi:probable phosphomutase (TIGR03848 family)